MNQTHVEVIGAGVAGLCCAQLFAERDCKVSLYASSDGPDENCCSWWAGGMLAPECEMESAEALIGVLGAESISFWKKYGVDVMSKGSLVVANTRDLPDLELFASKTAGSVSLDTQQLAQLEPDLENRFSRALFFEQECHLDPRRTLQALSSSLVAHPNVSIHYSTPVTDSSMSNDSEAHWRIDCRGLAARDVLSDLRGVKGEMLLLQLPELHLSRPIRLLHPRYPLYIVPREDHVFMIGATMIESDDKSSITARSLMELLSAAYALHPAFAQASVLEMGCDARPAFNDNLPRLRRRGKTLFINGLFRHGFLCAPAMARRAVDLALNKRVDTKVTDENED